MKNTKTQFTDAERKVFAKAGSMGGRATVKNHGKEFMSKIGKIKGLKNKKLATNKNKENGQ